MVPIGQNKVSKSFIKNVGEFDIREVANIEKLSISDSKVTKIESLTKTMTKYSLK